MAFMVLKFIGEICAGEKDLEVISKYPVGCSKFSRKAQMDCLYLSSDTVLNVQGKNLLHVSKFSADERTILGLSGLHPYLLHP